MRVKELKELIFLDKLDLQLLVNDSYFKRTVTSEEEQDLLLLAIYLKNMWWVVMLKNTISPFCKAKTKN